MITFIYSKEIERKIFEEYVLPKKSKEVSDLILSEIEQVQISDENEYISSLIIHINSEWKKVETNFYEKLGKFYGVNISEPEITCYFTRLDIFPYHYTSSGEINTGEQWFSAPLFGNPAERIRVIMHELCHYFQPVELPRDIKEAIPVILNDHDEFKMYGIDKGHGTDEEKKWREIIWDIYKKGDSFQDILKLIKEV